MKHSRTADRHLHVSLALLDNGKWEVNIRDDCTDVVHVYLDFFDSLIDQFVYGQEPLVVEDLARNYREDHDSRNLGKDQVNHFIRPDWFSIIEASIVTIADGCYRRGQEV